ncbi:MAG: BrnA antitoxin family protein [Terracidiphilus sp.]
MKSEDIKRRKWTKSEIEAVKRIAARQAAGNDFAIDYSDIPPLTEDQLARMVRFRTVRRKVPVSVRLDPQVLNWLKSKGEGHLTRINDILANLMEAERAARARRH